MKKTIKLMSVLLILLLLCIVINNNHSKTNQVLKGSFNNNQKEFNTTDALALMYEIDAGSGEYQTSSDTTWPEEEYVFNATLSKCENGGIVSWNEETKSVIVETNVSDKCYVFFDLKPTNLFADYIKGLYTSQGTNGIYYHDSSLANSAEDNSYRYAGANPNNYVCFGSDAATCPNDNLYRIIGVFDSEVKLIKSTSYGNYVWASSGSNIWDSNTKPDIRVTLNTTYYNTLSKAWQNKIATHTWKVGGMAYSTTNTAKQYYDVEVGSSSSSTPDSMKIGLMYVSDYGFAASNSNWTTALTSYDSATGANWLYLGDSEWTISREFSREYSVFDIVSGGIYSTLGTNFQMAMRPTFYLTSSTTYVSGSGTSSNPFRIN